MLRKIDLQNILNNTSNSTFLLRNFKTVPVSIWEEAIISQCKK